MQLLTKCENYNGVNIAKRCLACNRQAHAFLSCISQNTTKAVTFENGLLATHFNVGEKPRHGEPTLEVQLIMNSIADAAGRPAHA